MKGVNYITDSKGKKIAVTIDMQTLRKGKQAVEDLMDVIVAEDRMNESRISFDSVKKNLKRKGKL
jgi:hypothetical protein